MPNNGWILVGGALAWLIWVAVFTWGTTKASASDSAIFKSLFAKPGLQLIVAPLLVIALVMVFLLKLITAEAFLGFFGTAVGFIFGKATSKSE